MRRDGFSGIVLRKEVSLPADAKRGKGRKLQMRKKDELIPFEKRKRVIYMEQRGKEELHMPVLSVVLTVLGVLCILYCLGIALFVNYGTRFFLVWGVGGALLIALGWMAGCTEILVNMPAWLKILLGSIVGLCLLIFVLVEGSVLSRFASKGEENADYLIVLGAQMRTNGPSDVLQRRLNAAAEYLSENPDTLVIVSGGQGANEPETEAQGMYDYLVSAGIDSGRIRREDTSGNTYENLENSSRFLDREKDTVVVVTNNFHVFRALKIARKMGYKNVSGLAADSYPLMLPNNMLREFFGVVKDFLVGNL